MEKESSQSAPFNCNICLDTLSDPVVTLCGHLYCWPCIHHWLLQSHSPEIPSSPCPTCKSPLSENSFIPVYGQGPRTNTANVPPRPTPVRRSASREEERGHHVSNNLNGEGYFRNYLGTTGMLLGFNMESPYRCFNVPGSTRRRLLVESMLQQIWLMLLWFVVVCLVMF
ncbi:hypothetical protein LUZ60_000599 [Juncus effusus]|nr:hypothetical protein LUZ60_000599 [Juncus effusus]